MGATQIHNKPARGQVTPVPSSLLQFPLYDDKRDPIPLLCSCKLGTTGLIRAIAGQDTPSFTRRKAALSVDVRLRGADTDVRLRGADISRSFRLRASCLSIWSHALLWFVGSDPSPVRLLYYQSFSYTPIHPYTWLKTQTPARPKNWSQCPTCCQSPMRKRAREPQSPGRCQPDFPLLFQLERCSHIPAEIHSTRLGTAERCS